MRKVEDCQQKQDTLNANFAFKSWNLKVFIDDILRFFRELYKIFCFGFSICNLKFDLLISVSPSYTAVLG